MTYLSVNAHRGQGDWKCRGRWDKDIGAMIPCYFSAAPGEIDREPWRDKSDPAPEPEVASSNPAGAAALADVKFADGFAGMEKKEAATELLRVAKVGSSRAHPRLRVDSATLSTTASLRENCFPAPPLAARTNAARIGDVV